MKSLFLALLMLFFLLPVFSTPEIGESERPLKLKSCCWAWDGRYTGSGGHALQQAGRYAAHKKGKTVGETATLETATLTKFIGLLVILFVGAISLMAVFFQKE